MKLVTTPSKAGARPPRDPLNRAFYLPRLPREYHQAVADACINRGNVKDDKGDLDGAIADDTEVIALKPDFAIAYKISGYLKEEKGDYQGAIDNWQKAMQYDSSLKGELQTGLDKAKANLGK